MDYEWDENKRQENIRKHGWDFADAKKVWESGAPVVENFSERQGEDRFEATGKIGSRTVFVVYEDKGEDCRRIISFREASKAESLTYQREITRELGREDSNLTRLLSQGKEQTLELKKGPEIERRPEHDQENRER